MSIHEFLSDLYDRMGNIPQAYEHLKAFEKLKEEIFQQATLNKLRNLQIKNQIEVAKKEKEVAEKTAALKQQFMANMSHEIRTPMNAIVGITRLLLEKDPKPEQQKYLNVIRQSADNLLVIINDILDLSKIEAGKIVIEQIDFSLSDLIFSVQEIMALKAEQKGLSLNVEINKQIPDRLIGDPNRINQIFLNLIGNAIKFTDHGSVSLTCDIRSQETEKIMLEFKVADTGIGISEEYVGKIFESFTQAGTDTARKFGGTGLGLTISKQLVDLMEGEILVESKEGAGTTFTVLIPLIIAKEQNVAPKADHINQEVMKQLQHISLLLVEDNEFNRLVAEDTLKEILPDIKIDIAENGQIAVNKVRSNDYDLVLMDIQMPIMNGVDATRTIRTSLPKEKRNIGIIAMTANVLQEDVQQYLNAGMNAFVSKPFQTEALLMKMAMVLEGRQEYARSRDEEVPKGMGNLQTLPEKVTDMAFLNQFTGGNSEKKKKYILMFLDNGPKLLGRIKSAMSDLDYETVKVAAHSMKPQLSYMGIKEETSNIFLIEQTAGQSAHRENLPQLIQQLEVLCSQAFQELHAEID